MILYLYNTGKESIQATNVRAEKQQPLALISSKDEQRAIKLVHKHHNDRYPGKQLNVSIQ